MKDQQLHKDIALWIIRLNCDDPEERARVQLEFAQWQQAHPQAIAYLEEMSEFSQHIHHLSSQHHISAHTVQRTFRAVKKNQQNISKLFQGSALALSAIALTALLYKSIPFNYYLADYRTATGKMQSYTLSDGSKITLGAKSAIRLHFTAQKREIELVRGDIYVDVAKDPQRPLVVQTRQANFKALGTRFIVDQSHEQSSIAMLHSRVEVTNARSHTDQIVVEMGDQVRVNRQGIQAVQSIDPDIIEQAWQQQFIIAENLSLSEVLQKLQQYHDSYMIFDYEKLSQIKVNGVINAKQDLDLTLKLIKTQHPEVDFVQFGKFVTYAKLK